MRTLQKTLTLFVLSASFFCGAARADFPRGVVSLDLRDADVRDVIWAFAKEHKIDIIIGEDVKGKVTLSVNNVPIRTAFDSILDNAGLGFRTSGGIVRVNTLETIQKNQQIEPLVSRIVSVNYFTTSYGGSSSSQSALQGVGGLAATSAQGNNTTQDDLLRLKEALEPHLSSVKGASLSVVPRTNSLLITDIASNADRIVAMVNQLDVQTPQVLIEAKIVEVDADYSRDLGITTNFNSARTKNTQVGGGGSASYPGNGATVGPNGSILSDAASSAFDFFLHSVGADTITNLQIILTAAESQGRAKTLGTPRVTTLNNKEAIVSSGQRIPFTTLGSVAAQGGTNLVSTVQFIDAALQLAVTPHVTGQRSVMMKVRATRNTADFKNTVFQNPTINTREAINEVLVNDGDTIIIGGIYSDDSSKDRAGTPFLQDIPVIGNLFKQNSDSHTTRELIFLITPRIVTDPSIVRPKVNPASPGDPPSLGPPLAGLPSAPAPKANTPR